MAAPTMNWVRIYSDILTDPKMEDMTDTVKWRWVQLIVLAGECDEEGQLIDDGEALTIEYMARRFGVKPSRLSHDLDELMSKKLVTRLESVYFLPKFSERQGRKRSELREINRVRKERQRENTAKPENVTRDNTLSVPPTEKRREEKKREEKSKSGADAPAHVPQSPASQQVTKKQKPAKSPALFMDHPAVIIYRDLCHVTPNEIQRQLIADHNPEISRWEMSIKEWIAHGWNKANIPGMLERYESPPPPHSNGNGRNEPVGFTAIREAMLDPKYQEK